MEEGLAECSPWEMGCWGSSFSHIVETCASICWTPCLAAILIARALDFALGGMAKNGRFVVFISSRSAHFEF